MNWQALPFYVALVLLIGLPFANAAWGPLEPPPEPEPPAYQDPEDSPVAALVGASLGLVGFAAGLCWFAIGLAVFLAPLAALVYIFAH